MQPPYDRPAPVQIFRHPLLHHFSLSLFCKLPIASTVTMQNLKWMVMKRIIMSVFQFRINGRRVSGEGPGGWGPVCVQFRINGRREGRAGQVGEGECMVTRPVRRT